MRVQVGPGHGVGRRGHDPLGKEGRDTDDDHQDGQKRGRGPHAEGRVMGLVRVVVAHRAEEDVGHEAEGIGHRQERAERGEDGHGVVTAEPVGV
jgi:hypothetical protein